MTIIQIECFVEAAKLLNLTKAADKLYISQQTMSRQIKALEKELGYPIFERKNTGVRLTPSGAVLYHEWEELLEKYRSSIDKANDLYYGEQKNIRIGVSDMGNIVSHVSRALLTFNEKYPDLNVEYEIAPYPKMREALEAKRLHMIITFGSELLHETDIRMIEINNTAFRVGIVLSKRHPLNRKKKITIEDIQYEPLAVLGSQLSNDHYSRVQNWFFEHGIYHSLNLKEFNSFYNLQIALATEKCIGVLYERVMDGMEDKLVFYPLDDPSTDGADVAIAWKDDKYALKARNIAQLMETQVL